jgi:hypothetical protein
LPRRVGLQAIVVARRFVARLDQPFRLARPQAGGIERQRHRRDEIAPELRVRGGKRGIGADLPLDRRRRVRAIKARRQGAALPCEPCDQRER